jgi:hypothetical protein
MRTAELRAQRSPRRVNQTQLQETGSRTLANADRRDR